MKWFVALLALIGVARAAPVAQDESWQPLLHNSILDDPNELNKRGDLLYEHIDDPQYWEQFKEPKEIRQRVKELIHSPKFLHKISNEISNAKHTGRQDDNASSKTLLGVKLTPSKEDHVWAEAFTSVVNEQALFKNAAGDLVKAVLRVWGWVSLDLALYQGNGLFKF